MAFHNRKYQTYCFLGDPKTAPLWQWPQWNAVLPTLDPIIAAARAKAAVRSNQYLPNQQGTVKFGRIGWNVKGHEKWVHISPTNSPESSTWAFLSVEVWAPSWNVCQRENLAPDVFLGITNEALSGGHGRELSFNPVVIFAVFADLAEAIPEQVQAAASQIATTTAAKLCGHQVRPWGISSGIGFSYAIQDLGITGLFKPGPRHTDTVDFDLLAEKWKPFSP